MRLLAPNDTMRQVDIQGPRSRRYDWSRDGAVHVDDPSHVKALKAQGFTVAGVDRPSASRGFICGSCGFRTWFKACSRCGGECDRE